MKTYYELKTTTDLDHNSCTVIASSLAFDQDYNEILKYYDKQGRKRGSGVLPTKTKEINLKLAKKFDYKTKYLERKQVRELANGKTMTVGNCHKYLDYDKNYIIGIKGHSLAMVQGDVQDYTEGKKNHIISIMELTPPANKVQTVQSIEELLASADVLINLGK